MPIIKHATRPVHTLPGLKHQTLASGADQLQRLEIWIETLAPGGATPVHYHECEEIIVVLKGSGRMALAGQPNEFGPETTLIIPPNTIHQLTNTGAEEMFIVVSFSETPARSFAPDGRLIPIPWS